MPHRGETLRRVSGAGALLLTCEHASAAYPEAFAERLLGFHASDGGQAVFETHRALDLGALAAARGLAERTGAPLIATEVTRLVVDANRHPGHPRVLGPAFAEADPSLRSRLLAEHHEPHRRAVREAIGERLPVLHLAVHSMTPRLGDQERTMDMALLYDPGRPAERQLAAEWKVLMGRRLPALRLRRNAPYRGTSDGLPTTLRGELPTERYVGFELELNQRSHRPGEGEADWPAGWVDALASTFRELAFTFGDLARG